MTSNITVSIVVYCPRCDYYGAVVVQSGCVGDHLCLDCDRMMDVFIAQETTEVEYEQLLAEVERLRAIIKSARAALNGDSTQKVAREMANLAEILESVDKWPGLSL